MAFRLTWRTRIVVLMVPTWPGSGFREGIAGCGAGDWPGGRGRQPALPGRVGPAGARARVLGGRGWEFGINGESSGKDGVNTNRRSSLVFFELRRVTCGVVVHKAVDN